MRFFLSQAWLVLAVGCALPAGPGEPCSETTGCQTDLACFEGFCSGVGDAEPGDPCLGHVDCSPGSICFDESVCVGVGALRFSLTWTAETDLDLHVTTPTGQTVFYGNRVADGGVLDVDDCVGSCADPGGLHVENVIFADTAPTGTYTFWANNYDCDGPAEFVLEVFYSGFRETFVEGVLPDCGHDDTFTFDLRG